MNSKSSTTRPSLAVDVTTAAPRVESTGASIFAGASSTSVSGGEFSNLQRDQNRTTIIINVGGSDSNSSRATSAVSKTSVSGLARDSPDANSSSTSDEEQGSILEESSVFTDSGLGSSETSFEVESPLTEEEENALKEEPSNAIYERHMCLKKHGFPLWIPQPNMTLPRSYQRQGVSIGDVGIFTLDGGFDFLFNICLPAGHPSNPHELPGGFSRLDLNLADVCKSRAHSSQSYMSSPSVQKKSKAMTFKCSGSDGAILIMPQGAYHEDLRNVKRFRDYAAIHAESWYQYANGHCGREIGNAELHLVTGCDKTTSWGIATYLHRQSKSAEDNVTQLSFNVSNEGRHSYPTFAWDQEGDAEVKACPEHEEVMDLPEAHALAPLRNQCTFVRSLTPALCDDDWERLQSKVAASAEARASPGRSPKNTFVSVLGAISSVPGRIGFLGGHSRVGTSRLIDSLTPARTLAAHPATLVVDMLLQKCPKAKVVVVHDSDWCSVIRDSDNDWMSTYQDLQHRIQEAFDIVEEENGTIYLQEKMGSSQQPSTSSHVSVTLEGEDFPLFGGREPGFSQPFDSFEISPLDVKADSPDTSEVVSQQPKSRRLSNFDHMHLPQSHPIHPTNEPKPARQPKGDADDARGRAIEAKPRAAQEMVPPDSLVSQFGVNAPRDHRPYTVVPQDAVFTPSFAWPMVAPYGAAVNHIDRTGHLAEKSDPVGFEGGRDSTPVASTSKGNDVRFHRMMILGCDDISDGEALYAGYHDRPKRVTAADPTRDVKRKMVGSPELIAATKGRRKNMNQPGRFSCGICQADLTTKQNLTSKAVRRSSLLLTVTPSRPHELALWDQVPPL